MRTQADSESWLSPVRWALGNDGLVRPIWRAFLYLLSGFIFLVLLQRALHVGTEIQSERWLRLIFSLVVTVGLLLLAWLFLRVFDRRSFRALGLWFYAGWGRESLLGLGMGAGLVTAVVVGMALTQVLGYDGVNQTAGVWPATFHSAAFLLLAAAVEEILFRGYAFQRLVDSFGKVGAVLALSILFGLGHLGNPSANPLSTANTVLAGILLAVAYLKTRGLWLPIGLHWAWNLMLGPIYSLPVSGAHIGPGLFVAEIDGPTWLSGGGYGPEGSVVLTVVCVAAIIWLARTGAVAPSPAMEETLKSPLPRAAEGLE